MATLHNDGPILNAGAKLAEAQAALIMLHGRGSSADNILGLAPEIDVAGVAYLAPQASGGAWYPERFIAPVERNEPWLSAALAMIDALIAEAVTQGVPAERIGLLGFSQGACLALEYAARNPRRYALVAALSGGLIEHGDRQRDYSGTMADTPVFLGCSDVDVHIPVERVHRSAVVFTALGASVDKRIYPRMGHTVNQDELDAVRALLEQVAVR